MYLTPFTLGSAERRAGEKVTVFNSKSDSDGHRDLSRGHDSELGSAPLRLRERGRKALAQGPEVLLL